MGFSGMERVTENQTKRSINWSTFPFPLTVLSLIGTSFMLISLGCHTKKLKILQTFVCKSQKIVIANI